MIYCPRCDKRITPDHRCLSRRHFFGMLAGAAALLAAAPVLPLVHPAQAKAFTDARDRVLYPGDRLSISFSGTPAEPLKWGAMLQIEGHANPHFLQGACSSSGEPLFIAPTNYIVTDVRVLVGGTVHRVPIEITRSAK